ncbi:hypothetical protein [Spiroplasma sp. DGKH1]|uniref:hypothetical protein n=1 Tax=Spiroplasma sp. DGKH1 TaxID=3050074 RepID=UPI0034C68A16
MNWRYFLKRFNMKLLPTLYLIFLCWYFFMFFFLPALVPWVLLILVFTWMKKKFNTKAIFFSGWFIIPLILTLWMFILQIGFVIFAFKQFHESLFVLGWITLFGTYYTIIIFQKFKFGYFFIEEKEPIKSDLEIITIIPNQAPRWLLFIIVLQNKIRKLKIKTVLSPPSFLK